MTNTLENTRLLLTLREAAEQLAVSDRVLWQLAKDRVIPSVRVGPRGLRFSLEALRKWIAEQEQKSAGVQPAA